MAFDITPYVNMSPADVRQLIREGRIDFPTAGMCAGYAQANLVILPPDYAADFEEYARLNPFPCPLLEIIRGPEPLTRAMAGGANICTDIPRYRIYENGVFVREVTDASAYWQEGFVGFLIGCSFSFEEALMREGIEVRHIAQGRNVPMYKVPAFPTRPAGPFRGPMVCSMRPMTPENAWKAYQITARMPNVHGAPVHMGPAAAIGIQDVTKPDYGDPVDICPGEIPVFWPCGVTPQAAVENAKPPLVITHAPGHMFITDVLNAELNDYLEEMKKK
nr:putative hydro-lyase [Lachnospiraceae bacterium]